MTKEELILFLMKVRKDLVEQKTQGSFGSKTFETLRDIEKVVAVNRKS